MPEPPLNASPGDVNSARGSALVEALRQRGLFVDTVPDASAVHPDVVIETPASIAALVQLHEPFRLGAFSHLNGGFIKNVHIGRYCSFARDVQIGHGFHPTNWLSVSPLQYSGNYRGWLKFVDQRAHIATRSFRYEMITRIGHDVWIGNHVLVKDGVTIGDGAIVGAGSVVTRDVAPYAIVAGNPARLLRMRFADDLIARLLNVQWWRYSLASFGPIDFSDIRSALSRIEDLVGGDLEPYRAPEIVAADLAALR